jgi:hypothetical protein
MKTENYLGLTLSVGFGLWWALFPNGVIRFYEWFHRRKMSTPKPLAIRIVGVLWIALVLTVVLYKFR